MRLYDAADMFLMLLLGFMLSTMLWIAILLPMIKAQYRDGQIDALTGEIKYCLISNDRQEKNWQECKDE